jgi:hypothetical protein
MPRQPSPCQGTLRERRHIFLGGAFAWILPTRLTGEPRTIRKNSSLLSRTSSLGVDAEGQCRGRQSMHWHRSRRAIRLPRRQRWPRPIAPPASSRERSRGERTPRASPAATSDHRPKAADTGTGVPVMPVPGNWLTVWLPRSALLEQPIEIGKLNIARVGRVAPTRFSDLRQVCVVVPLRTVRPSVDRQQQRRAIRAW